VEVAVLSTALVASFTIVTVALPITAPLGSVTDPAIPPDWAPCENAIAVKNITARSSTTQRGNT
jgi:hypothetical protein